MDEKDFLRPQGSGCIVSIDASPGAKRTEIAGLNRWRGSVQIKIAAEPKEGEANEELVRFLAEVFAVPRDSVRLLKGERASRKSVFLPVDVERARAVLGGH
jgi:uncharacterized protein (TIGR00251 family)